MSILLISTLVTSAVIMTAAKENKTNVGDLITQEKGINKINLPSVDKSTIVTGPDTSKISSSSVPYSAIFTMIDSKGYSINNGQCEQCPTEITNYTFYLPKASYVYVESSGRADNFRGSVSIWMGVDNLYDTNRGYFFTSSPPNNDCNMCWTGFQISRGYYLLAGYHTIHLSGTIWNPWMYDQANFVNIGITAIANEKGNIQVK